MRTINYLQILIWVMGVAINYCIDGEVLIGGTIGATLGLIIALSI